MRCLYRIAGRPSKLHRGNRSAVPAHDGPRPPRLQDTRSAPETAQTPPQTAFCRLNLQDKLFLVMALVSKAWASQGIRMHLLMCRFPVATQRRVYTSWTFSSGFVVALLIPAALPPQTKLHRMGMLTLGRGTTWTRTLLHLCPYLGSIATLLSKP